MEARGNSAPHVLLIEDNERDIALIQAALAELPGSVQLHIARDGTEAYQQLRHDPRISLVLLDQRLPGEDGLQWLVSLKSDADLALRRVPVVMLSGSDTEEQIRSAYHAYASAYLIKPNDPEGLRQMLGALITFWGDVARLPQRI